jgi:fatty-acid desaturase
MGFNIFPKPIISQNKMQGMELTSFFLFVVCIIFLQQAVNAWSGLTSTWVPISIVFVANATLCVNVGTHALYKVAANAILQTPINKYNEWMNESINK